MATDTSMRSSAPVGFWGPPTSTIDWCESNYEHNYYIAEFWNTISNSLFVLLGLYGLYRSIKMGFEPRFHLQFIGVMITGFGSAMFHGTLQHVYQQCDETPMVWSILAWIYIVYNNEIEQIPMQNASTYVIAFLTTIGAIFTVVHAIYRFTTVFQVFFGILAVLGAGRLCMHYAEVKDPRARAVARSYVTSSLIGFAFWMMDYHYCHIVRGLPVNPQGHAWYDYCSGSLLCRC
ncbi:Alkaline phytoceramidase [Phytophthora megakarya]|uniref:Alkaline phytoceramidase n=1 Tax=Phytophthora megakarya TaxID=4795 RepID=A0A225WMH3_9STRA|nr:Alkaline phytoceramidase [Phytophthora megakarya]